MDFPENDRKIELPKAYKTTLEKESNKQTMMIKIKWLVQDFK